MHFTGLSYDFSDATVLITGGSQGIGMGCAQAYRSAGANVIITGRRPAAADYDTDLAGMDYRQLDVSDSQALTDLAGSLDKLDILVNNAGATQPEEWSTQGFDASLAINLSSVFQLSNQCRSLLEASEFAGGASVIGIASMTSYFGFEMTPAYGAAKAGLVQLTKTLGVSWGKFGIRANAVAAGLTRTNLTSAAIDAIPEILEASFTRQGIHRAGEIEDIAAAVLFLSCPAASWITGQTLPVDGGFTTGMS